MAITPQDIHHLRTARRVRIRQRDDGAALTCIGTVDPKGGLWSRFVASLRDTEHEVPVEAYDPGALRGTRWGRPWRRGRELVVDDAYRDPAWAAASRSFRPGSQLGVHWTDDARRFGADAVQMTVSNPYGPPPPPFVLVGTPADDSTGHRPRRRRRRGRRSRRGLLPRAVLSLLALWFLVTNSALLATVTIAAFAVLVILGRWARTHTDGRGARFWKVSVVGWIMSTLLSSVPFVAIVLLAVIALRLAWRHRKTIRRIVRRLRGRRDDDHRGDIVPIRPAGGSWWGDTAASVLEMPGWDGAPVPSLPGWSGDAVIPDPRMQKVVENIAKHVGRVAEMCDGLAPGWAFRVRPDRLQPADPADHLLAAAFEDHDRGLAALTRFAVEQDVADLLPCIRAVLDNEACAHIPATQDLSHNYLLCRYWLHEVNRRAGAAQRA